MFAFGDFKRILNPHSTILTHIFSMVDFASLLKLHEVSAGIKIMALCDSRLSKHAKNLAEIKDYSAEIVKIFAASMPLYHLPKQDPNWNGENIPFLTHEDMKHSMARCHSCVMFKLKYILLSDGFTDDSDACAGHDVLMYYKGNHTWKYSLNEKGEIAGYDIYSKLASKGSKIVKKLLTEGRYLTGRLAITLDK
jgi:hypothetical protein